MSKLLRLVIVLCFPLLAQAQLSPMIPSESPKLVVAIVIDHFRSDYIHKYSQMLGSGGLKKIMTEGSYCKDTRYAYEYSQTGVDHASIFTGTSPSFHGVVSHNWFNRLLNKQEGDCDDANVVLLGAKDTAFGKSAHKMLASTIGDQIKLSNKYSKVVGLSMHPRQALFSIGHAADAAYWYDNLSGNFISSTYYMNNLPEWVNQFNAKKFAEFYIDKQWKPLEVSNLQTFSDKVKTKLGVDVDFSYDIKKKFKSTGYNALLSSPYSNTILKDFAISTIVNLNMGKDDDVDFLSVNFSFLNQDHNDFPPFSPQMLDAFVRLDRDLEHFINFLDQQVGMENVLLLVTASQSANYTKENMAVNNMPTGYFSMYNCVALLKSYLNIIFGSGNWIQTYDSKQVYLNHKLINDSKYSISEIQDKVADFIIQFSGVAKTITASSLSKSNFTQGAMKRVQASFNQKRSGDVFICLESGWRHSVKDDRDVTGEYSYTTQVPLMWYGWKIKRGVISRKIGIEDIVPSISDFLNMPLSPACDGQIIPELIGY